MATGKKMLFGALLAACACSVYGTTNIVHDAARDLVLNTANKAVYTNFYGGVWSFMRSKTYNGARTLLPSVRYRVNSGETDGSGANYKNQDGTQGTDLPIYWERGPAKDNSSSPCFSVNPSPWADTNVFMRGAAYPTIQPGELSCHPGPIDGSVNQCIELRFTVPRDGTYTVIAKAWNRNAGWTAVALFVNGTERGARRAWKSSATAVVTNDFSLAAATYAAGDTIEMSIDGNNTFNSNATGLDFRIEEEVEAVYDASSAFLANFNSDTPANPYTDSFGTWSAYFATNITQNGQRQYTPTNAPRTRLPATRYTRPEKGGAMAGLAWYNGLPYITANISGAMATETNSAGKALTATGRAFLPGELNIFPRDGSGAATILEVRPSVGGVFDVGVTFRDMFYSNPNAGDSGVNVWLLQGGEVLANAYITVERGGNYPSATSFFFKDVRIMPQIPLAVAVDTHYGSNNSDGTGTFWAFIRKGDFSATYDANAALKANMTSASPTNPFTHNGATWTAGLCSNVWKGTFTPYTVEQKRYHDWFSGWSDNASASPFWAINVKGSELTPGDMDGNSILGAGSDMMLAHPKNDASTTALRFTVPADGVYSVTAWLADLSYDQGNSSADDGVAVHLVAEGHHADSAIVRLRKLHTGQEARRLAADRLFLRKDETMTFAVGRNGAYQWDMTGSFIWIDPESDAAALQGVNIDLDCKGAGATYAGTGRVGYAGERWNGLAVEDGAAGCESKQLFAASGTRTGVTLALAKTDDALTSSAANLATDTTAAALFADGVVSTNSTDVNAFTLAGLLPNTKYELYFFSRALTNTPPATAQSIVRGTFTAGSVTAVSAKTWFADSYGDYARIDAVSNADGEIAGTFRSASAEAEAFWCGLQILGPGFSPYIPKGATIIFR